MNYKNIILCFIVLFSSVKSHCNETIVDYFNFNIDKTKILPFFCVAAIVALLYNGIVNYFNNFDYICTYLKFYIFNRDPNIQDKTGNTLLHEDYNTSNIECVKLLLSHPTIDPNIKNKKDHTPLDSARISKRIEVIKLLLNCPQTNPNIQDKDGWTQLYYCCVNSTQMDLEIIKLLLAHTKINPNIPNKYGDTPLTSACRQNNIECVNLLLSHRRIENNINYKQIKLHIACSNNETTAIKELLTKFHPNIRDENGNTALHLACAQNNTTIAAQLINDKRTSLDSKNKAGSTPLIIAANSEKAIEIIPILITHRIGFDEHQYLFYKACKKFNIVNDLIKSIFSYYEAITISQQFHNFPKKNSLQLEQIRKNCIKIVCEKKGYINPYQRAIL